MAAASASNPTPRIANCVDMASSPCVVFSDLQGRGFKIKHDCMFYETRRQPRRGVTLNGCFQRRFDNASGPNIQTCTIECFNYVADMSPSTPWTEEEMSRSEEHTSELQSLMRITYAVFCLKNKKQKYKGKMNL